VSLARYRKLITHLSSGYKQMLSVTADNYCERLIVPLFIRYVWEKSHSKHCLLNFYTSVEKFSNKSLILEKYNHLRDSNSNMTMEWLRSSFQTSDFKPEAVQTALNNFLSATCRGKIMNGGNEYPCKTKDNLEYTINSETFGSAFELLAASLAYDRAFKPAIRLGRYKFITIPLLLHDIFTVIPF